MTKFELGRVVITQGAIHDLNHDDLDVCMIRYVNCDWGDLCDDDKQMNDNAVKNNDDRIVAKYHDRNGNNFYVITEWDRSVTTILLTGEY